MSGGLSASSPPLYSSSSCISSKTQIIITRSYCNLSWSSRAAAASVLPRTSGVNLKPRITSLRCNSSTRPGGPSPPGENENRTVLDAFFLGKALAEALNERIESTVGEFLSTIGRLQAEQQKQVQDFRYLREKEEVLERAKKSKEKAAREAMEVQGLIPKSSVNTTTVSSASESPALSAATPNSSATTSDKNHNPTSTSPRLEGSTED